MAGPIGSGNTGSDHGVEQASAVEGTGQVVVCSPAADFGDGIVRLDASSSAVVCVFQTNEARADKVVIGGRANAANQLFDLEDPMITFDGLRGDAEELGVGALLVADN